VPESNRDTFDLPPKRVKCELLVLKTTWFSFSQSHLVVLRRKLVLVMGDCVASGRVASPGSHQPSAAIHDSDARHV
jgi:hypothetical protein